MDWNAAARVRSVGIGALAFAAVGGTAEAETQPLSAHFKKRNVLAGGRVPVTGTLLTHQAGRKVLLQAANGHGWHTVARTKTGRNGAFRATFTPRALGSYRLRVRLVGAAASSASGAHVSAKRQHGHVRVYRPTNASWYGPGLLGGRTACGGTLDSTTLGVANRTLPCGTRVTFHYRGRTVTAKVIDRGPFVGGREWDLTPATKAKLGFGSTGTVWSTR
jgi:rare lipoprotein A (peptidoglycan hydrolase)